MRQKSEREDQWECGMTGTDVWGRDNVGIGERTDIELEGAQMRMLRRMCRVPKREKIINERIGGQRKWAKSQKKPRIGG